jgi:uncharacterized protein (TIGR03435 family)
VSRFISGAGLAFLIAGPIHAQTSAKPEFEVVSIKPAPPPGMQRIRVGNTGGPGSPDPGLFSCTNCTLGMLVSLAFDLKRFQLTGAPSWLETDRFHVSARVPAGATKEQFRLMQQALLIARFGLKYHWEKKEMQTYDLVIAKGGSKLKQSADASPSEADTLRSSGIRPLELDKDRLPIVRPGQPSTMSSATRSRLRAIQEPMDHFVTLLASQLNRPVTNLTTLQGKYDIDLAWVREEATERDPDGRTLFAALQEQLGLKLEPKKGMVDILVIDKVERMPTEN